jgi:N-acetylmuramic acid 6-phosphate etherase
VAGFANVAGSPLLTLAHLPVLLETGAEIVSGSTRMGAGTAQKAALNLMSVLVGIRLGHVHDGYMVNVLADNAKLRDRAAGIVAAVAAVDAATARAALAATEGAVKPAVLVARGLSPDAASAALDAADGHLSRAFATLFNEPPGADPGHQGD